MHTLSLSGPRAPGLLWRDCIAPKEHGSWSLAFEPIALALLVAPTVPGAFLAASLAAAFFARRPLRLIRFEQRPERRAAAKEALAWCAGVAGAAGIGAVAAGGLAWLAWMLPLAVFAAAFAWFDLQGAGRDEAAEAFGAAAFALAPAAFAALAGWSRLECAGIALVALGRAVPSVLAVRAYLRAAKTGVRRDAPALFAAALAVGACAFAVTLHAAPASALVAMLGFAGRSIGLLVVVRPAWRARTVGMIEAALGVAFVLLLALTWN